MTNDQLLRATNREIAILDADWWMNPTRRVHPARHIKVNTVRSPEAELVAREFFAKIAQDPELLIKRAMILLQWSFKRTNNVESVSAAVKTPRVNGSGNDRTKS